jgi:hypothetical protein
MAINIKAVTNAMGYEQITSLSAAAALSPPSTTKTGLAAKPTFALIVAETQAIRWRDDGIDPTATVGMPLAAGATLQYDGDLTRIRFIEQTASAKVNVSYYD